MAYLALSTLLDEFSQHIGDPGYYSGTTDGTGTNLTLVDSTLYSRFAKNNELLNKFVLLTSGTYSGQKRIIYDPTNGHYTASTGTARWLDALGGNSGTGVTYQIHGIDSTHKIDALNAARKLGFNRGFLVRPLAYDMVSGSPLPNGGFNLWNAAESMPLGWKDNGSAITTTHISGPNNNNIVNCVATGSDYLRTTPDFYADSLRLAGKTVSIYCDVQCDVASRARIGIDLDAGIQYSDEYFNYNATTTTAAYHPGDGAWYRLQLEDVAIPSTNGTIRFVLSVAGVVTAPNYARFSNFRVKGGNTMYEYPIPMMGFVDGVSYLEYAPLGALTRQDYADLWAEQSDWRYDEIASMQDEPSTTLGTVGRLMLTSPITEGYRMRAWGVGLLSSVSAMTDKMQIDNDKSLYLYNLAEHLLYKRLQGQARGQGERDEAKAFGEQSMEALAHAAEMERHLSRPHIPLRSVPMML